MECKNCQITLSENDNFCPNCGAKIIKNRLTLKIILSEFFATFISWDNTIIQTFKHLFTKPDKVIIPYINGTRKRYVKPFTFLLIALTLYGIYLSFSSTLYFDAISNGFNFNNNKVTFNKESIEKFKKILTFTVKYFNFFMFLMIPFYAFLSKKAFKTYNFVEHIVLVSYLQAEIFITTTILISLLLLFKVNVLVATNIISPFSYIYLFYVYMKVFKLSFIDTLVKFLIWIAYLIVYSIVIMVLIGILIGIFKIITNGM